MTEFKKICKNCGKDNSRPRSEYCSVDCSRVYRQAHNRKICEFCKKEHTRRGRTCSNVCANELKKRSNLKKFGHEWAIQSDEAKAKRVETNLEKYGADHHLKTEESLSRLRETNRKRYGTDYVSQNKEVQSKIAKTNLERYGSSNVLNSKEIRDRIEQESLLKYGTKNPALSPDAIKKRKETNVSRYGVENVFSSEEVKAKIRSTMMEKYGVEFAGQAEELKSKARETNIKRYGHPVPFQSESVKEKGRRTNLERLGFEYPTQSEVVREKVAKTVQERLKNGEISLPTRMSKINVSTAELIKDVFGFDVSFEKPFGKGFSSDLFVEEMNLMIDINPTISHNVDLPFGCLLSNCTEECGKHKRLSDSYHQKRAKAARAEGISLVQIYDWDLPRIIELLEGKLARRERRISARKLSIEMISQKDANRFLKITHYQGAAMKQKYCYGLYSSGDLLAVGTFGESRFGSPYEYEFIRYAVEKNTTVYGGAGLILKEFIKSVDPESIVSYVNFDHSTGPSFLESSGFTEERLTNPALYWSRREIGLNNNSVLSQGADRLLGTNYGSIEKSGLNNSDILFKEGFKRVYTSGNRVFVWRKKN